MKDLISRFTPVLIFTLLGLLVIVFGVNSGQGSEFMIGGGAILLIALIVLLNALQIVSNIISVVLSVLLLVASAGLIYYNFDSINGPIQFLKKKEKRYAYVIQNLKDIREAQLAFKKQNGKYAPTFDSLVQFVKTDSIPVVKRSGSVPDGLTMELAIDSGYLTLDTSLVPAMEVVYPEEYKAARYKRQPLSLDSLKYVPFGGGAEFEMEVSTIERTGGIQVPVIEVRDSKPFDPTDVMKFGSLSEPSTSGNWKEEK